MMLNDNTIRHLGELFTALESDGSLDDCLSELSSITARILHAQYCNIVLLTDEEARDMPGGHQTRFGFMPAKPAKSARVWFDLAQSSHCLREDGNKNVSVSMLSMMVLNGRTIGIIQATSAPDSAGFRDDDLGLFTILTAIITKSIQVIQLQHVLRSQFTQLALINTSQGNLRNLLSGAIHNPNQIARILAKSFYREMLNAGFSLNQILFAATEVISELSASVRKQSARRKNRSTNGEKVVDDIMSISPPAIETDRVAGISA